MRGYFKNPELTAKSFDKDGWLHSGDLGEIDDKGFVRFKGRVNEICKSSYGEIINIPVLEERLNQISFIDHSIVIADNRPYVTCLFFVDKDALSELKHKLGLTNLSDEEVLERDYVKKGFDNQIENLNIHFNPWERIRAYRFIFINPTVEGGELPPTMKLIRYRIESKYKTLIEEMYPRKK